MTTQDIELKAFVFCVKRKRNNDNGASMEFFDIARVKKLIRDHAEDFFACKTSSKERAPELKYNQFQSSISLKSRCFSTLFINPPKNR